MCWIWRQAHTTHGRINVRQAIVDSCNYFYYEVGRLTGIKKLDEYATAFGLGQSTGIEIGDVSGVLASPEWAESHDREWTDGQTIPTTCSPPCSWPTMWLRWYPAASTMRRIF